MDNHEFFDNIYREQSQRMYRIACRLLNDPDLAYDVTNDTFLILFLKIEELKVHPKPVYWLLRTLRNRIGNELQMAHRAHDIPLNEALGLESGTVEDEVITLSDCLPSRLPDKEKEILVLYYEKRYSCEDISKIIDRSPSACRERLSRARAHCKQLMEKSF